MGNTFTIINEKGELETLYSGDLKNPSAYILAEQDGDSPCWYWPEMDLERWYSSFVHVQVQESG